MNKLFSGFIVSAVFLIITILPITISSLTVGVLVGLLIPPATSAILITFVSFVITSAILGFILGVLSG